MGSDVQAHFFFCNFFGLGELPTFPFFVTKPKLFNFGFDESILLKKPMFSQELPNPL